MFVLQMSPPEQSPSPEQEVGPEGSVLQRPVLVSHMPPGHELSPPIESQPGAQIGPAFTLSVRQMLSVPTQSSSELHDLCSHMLESVLQKVSVKPAAEQSSLVVHAGWQRLPITVLQMSPFGQAVPSLGQWAPPSPPVGGGDGIPNK